MLLKGKFDFFLFFAFRDLWRPIITPAKFELEIPNGSALFRCMLFVNERPPLLVPVRSQGVRDVVMSSKQSAQRRGDSSTRGKISRCACSSFVKKNWQIYRPCRCVVQDCSNKSNPRIGISLQTPKSNYELAKWKAFVRTHISKFNTMGLFKICSVHQGNKH